MQYKYLSLDDYLNQRFDFLKKVEGVELPAYVDSKGIPTIGLGFRLSDNLDAILTQFGVDMANLSISDANIVANIRAAVQQTYPKGNAGNIALNNAIAPLFQQLSQKNRSTFSFNNETEVKTFYNDVIAPTYESKLDTWLGAGLPDLKYCSKERLALLSLVVYNGVNSPNLKNALINGDRLRAWYEIRYASNLDKIQYKRRYGESDMFGLWDGTAPTQTELTAFENFIKQNDPYNTSLSILQRIRNYEADYDPHNSTVLGLPISNRIDETINSSAVRNYFISKYGQGQNINGNIIIGTELSNKIITTTGAFNSSAVKAGYLKSTDESDLILGEKGADLIDGANGDDVIYGGEGNDQIIGGKGNDILEGGAGNDDYIFQSGDGSDKINDSEGTNRILWEDTNGNLHVEKTFYKTSDAEWKSADGTTEVNQNSPYKMVFQDGTTVELGDSINSFDINLKDVPSNPTTTHEIVEDNWSHEAFYGGIIDTASRHLLVV